MDHGRVRKGLHGRRAHRYLFDPIGGWLVSHTSEGPFSAVSKPIFATQGSFCSILEDLQDGHAFTPLELQNL